MIYTMKDAAAELGIGVHRLRYLIRRGYVRPPERNSAGHRLIHPEDLQKIADVVTQIDAERLRRGYR